MWDKSAGVSPATQRQMKRQQKKHRIKYFTQPYKCGRTRERSRQWYFPPTA